MVLMGGGLGCGFAIAFRALTGHLRLDPDDPVVIIEATGGERDSPAGGNGNEPLSGGRTCFGRWVRSDSDRTALLIMSISTWR